MLALAFPALVPGVALGAGSIAASRVFLGVHYVSDVLAGALIGLAVGGTCWWLLLA